MQTQDGITDYKEADIFIDEKNQCIHFGDDCMNQYNVKCISPVQTDTGLYGAVFKFEDRPYAETYWCFSSKESRDEILSHICQLAGLTPDRYVRAA